MIHKLICKKKTAMTNNITNHRKAGRLDEAYKLAEQNLTANPTDIWNVRNMAWVLYEYAKQKANVGTKEQFLRCINKIIELDAPATYESIKNDLAVVQAAYDNNDSILVVPISTDYLRSMKIIGQNIDIDLILHNRNTLIF